MKRRRPALVTAALGSTLLMGACFGGAAAAPAPTTSGVATVPGTLDPPPAPIAPSAPDPPGTVPLPSRTPGNDHDADNNAGSDDGDGNK